jgi:hypothetical protein
MQVVKFPLFATAGRGESPNRVREVAAKGRSLISEMNEYL